MTPYWTSPDGTITVFCARWEDAVAAGVVPVREVSLVHADGPYGTGQNFNRGGAVGQVRSVTTARAPGKVREYPALVGDDERFDPAPLLALRRPLVTWGANYYSDSLPPSTAWLFWDKRAGTVSDDGADGELAWSNLGGALRTFRHAWRGLARASETGTPHLHPTQKPIALSSWVFQRARLKRGDLVFVPYMGSGPDLPACVAAGLRCIACEVSEAYCATAIARLGAVTAERAAETAGPLFEVRR